jgi:CheY-like chemotaxis protein
MSKRILVVEDQLDNRQIIRDMLAPTDYEITEAENGEEALAAIAIQRPDRLRSRGNQAAIKSAIRGFRLGHFGRQDGADAALY